MIEQTPEQEQFITDQVSHGPFQKQSEVIEAALELLRQRLQQDYDETVESIRQGLKDYEAGKGQPLAEACDDIRRSLGID